MTTGQHAPGHPSLAAPHSPAAPALKADAPATDPAAAPAAPASDAAAGSSGVMGMLETFIGAILPTEDRVNTVLDAGRTMAEGAIHNVLMTVEDRIRQYYLKNIKKS